MQAPECIWRRLLPDYVKVSVGPGVASPTKLTSTEKASASIMGYGRKAEFLAGRSHAHAALAKLGLDRVELPVGKDRAPIWPDGVKGSITHATDAEKSYFAAAAGQSALIGGIGIDAEFISAIRPQIWRQFLTARELEAIRSLQTADRANAVAAIWCAKEAMTKAIGLVIEPSCISAVPRQKSDEIVQTWKIELIDMIGAQPAVESRAACQDGLALAAVVLPPPYRDRIRRHIEISKIDDSKRQVRGAVLV